MRAGALPVLIAGLCWAALCLLLAAGGHAPSVALLPIPKRHYYLAQAAFVTPLLFGLFWIATSVTHRVARMLGGSGNLAGIARGMGFAIAVPIVLCVVLVDLIVYLTFGFETLGKALRVSAPVATVLSVVLATRAVRDAHALPVSRACFAALAGVIAQALVGGVALR